MQSGMTEMKHSSMFNFEQKLSRMIKPVKPDPVFLNSLKTRLSHSPSILLETSKKQIGLAIFGAGLFTGALILWIINAIKKAKNLRS